MIGTIFLYILQDTGWPVGINLTPFLLNIS